VKPSFFSISCEAEHRDCQNRQPKGTIMSTKFTSTGDKMKTVKAAWDKAPAGPKKDTALTHYQAAEKARTAKNDAECLKELDAATHALA
jgi:hypothetical protein